MFKQTLRVHYEGIPKRTSRVLSRVAVHAVLDVTFGR